MTDQNFLAMPADARRRRHHAADRRPAHRRGDPDPSGRPWCGSNVDGILRGLRLDAGAAAAPMVATRDAQGACSGVLGPPGGGPRAPKPAEHYPAGTVACPSTVLPQQVMAVGVQPTGGPSVVASGRSLAGLARESPADSVGSVKVCCPVGGRLRFGSTEA